jgi:hypothetical protein
MLFQCSLQVAVLFDMFLSCITSGPPRHQLIVIIPQRQVFVLICSSYSWRISLACSNIRLADLDVFPCWLPRLCTYQLSHTRLNIITLQTYLLQHATRIRQASLLEQEIQTMMADHPSHLNITATMIVIMPCTVHPSMSLQPSVFSQNVDAIKEPTIVSPAVSNFHC